MSLGGGSSGGTNTTITKQELPEWAKKHLQYGGKYARREMRSDWDNPKGFFPGQTYADLNSRQTLGMDRMAGLAAGGGAFIRKDALREAGRTTRGDYLGDIQGGDVLGGYDPTGAMGGKMSYDLGMPNFNEANFSNMVMAAAHPELRSINSNFAAAGRSGGLADEAVADAISRNFAGALGQERNMRAGLYDSERSRLGSMYTAERGLQGGLYDSERGRMAGMVGMSPALDALAYSPYERLYQSGAPLQANTQAGINDAMARYNYDPRGEALDQYINRIAGLVPGAGGVTRKNEPMTGSPLMTGLGGAATGAGIGEAMGMTLAANPVGLPILAAGGGLLGLLAGRG